MLCWCHRKSETITLRVYEAIILRVLWILFTCIARRHSSEHQSLSNPSFSVRNSRRCTEQIPRRTRREGEQRAATEHVSPNPRSDAWIKTRAHPVNGNFFTLRPAPFHTLHLIVSEVIYAIILLHKNISDFRKIRNNRNTSRFFFSSRAPLLIIKHFRDINGTPTHNALPWTWQSNFLLATLKLVRNHNLSLFFWLLCGRCRFTEFTNSISYWFTE